MAQFDASDPDEREKLRGMVSPLQVEQSIRAAIQMCWFMLPEAQRNVAEVEKQIRRLVDRSLANLREDMDAFGMH